MTNKDNYVFSSKRSECPLCGSGDGRADIIFDKRTNIHYKPDMGYFKCHSCGETRSPNYEDKFSNEEWRNMEKQKINPNPKPQPKQKTANEIKAILNANYADSMANQSSNFHNWINNLSRDSTSFDTMEIGTDKIGATNFWYRDIDGNLTYAKTMAYSETGDRLKEDANPLKNADGTSKIALNGYVKGTSSKGLIYEYHISDLGYNTSGIFNYNRLAQGDYESIFILESEKNCVLASILMPEYCFVTGGGSTAYTLEKSLIVEKFATKFNKNVFVLYDLDKSGFDNAIAICNREFLVTDYTSVFDEFIKSKKQIEIKIGYDVADFCKLVFERKIKKMHLIKELDKIFNSYFETEKPKKDATAKSIASYKETKNYINQFYQFRYNVIKTRYEYKKVSQQNWNHINDRVYNSIYIEMLDSGIEVDFNKMVKYIESETSPEYDPFKEWLAGLANYDINTEPDYIKLLASVIDVNECDVERRNDYFTRWFVSLYAQATLQNCSQFLLIFIGSHGIGKDQFAKSLLPKTFREYVSGFNFMNVNTDAKFAMCNNLILSCTELEYMNKADQAKVKDTIGVNDFFMRASYGRVNQTYYRRSALIGSANSRSILADETGSRRYLVMESTNINWKDINDKLLERAYKQAEYMYDVLHYNFHFTQDEIAEVNDYNEQYRTTTLPEELIKQHFKVCENHSEGLTSGELLLKLMQYSNQTREYHNTRLGAILQKLGYTQKLVKVGNQVSRRYNITEKVNFNKYVNDYINN